jgi:hypothetical protein
MAPVSLMFFSVPVNSCAPACPAQPAMASVYAIIRHCLIRIFSSLDGFGPFDDSLRSPP